MIQFHLKVVQSKEQSGQTYYQISRPSNSGVRTFLYLCIKRPRMKSNVKKCNKRQTMNISKTLLEEVLILGYLYKIKILFKWRRWPKWQKKIIFKVILLCISDFVLIYLKMIIKMNPIIVSSKFLQLGHFFQKSTLFCIPMKIHNQSESPLV